eukprot:6412180-Pyramimonas_sp.AAC.1
MSTRIRTISKQLKDTARAYWEQIQKRRRAEMTQALKDQNGYLVPKLARLIAGRRRGPRQRRLAVVPGSAASASAWAQRLKLEPDRGGCRAISYT